MNRKKKNVTRMTYVSSEQHLYELMHGLSYLSSVFQANNDQDGGCVTRHKGYEAELDIYI